jgi:hypothetical protein
MLRQPFPLRIAAGTFGAERLPAQHAIRPVV